MPAVLVISQASREEHPVPELSDHDPERRFGSLYQEHYRSIQAYAVRRVEPRADVADVVATSSLSPGAGSPRLPPPGDRLWLYGVARRVIAGRHRSSGASAGWPRRSPRPRRVRVRPG